MQDLPMPELQHQPFNGEIPPFPSIVDNTMRSAFISCPRKWMYSFLHSWAPIAPNVHLHAGGAFAKGLEVARRAFFEEGQSEGESLRRGLEALMQFYGNIEFPPTRSGDKSLDNVIRAFDSYMRRYRLGVDPLKPIKTASGRCMVEFTFSIPTQVFNPYCQRCLKISPPNQPVCRYCGEPLDPILYGGRSDMIGDYHGSVYVTDEKTTSSLGEQWSNKWELHSQFTGYVAAARFYGYPVVGAIVRGVGLLKTKITHADVILSRGDWVVQRWWWQLHRDLQRMVTAYYESTYDWAIDEHVCAAYGGCAFVPMCSSTEPEKWLVHFRKRTWDPLAKDMGEKLLERKDIEQRPDGLAEIDLKDLS